MKPILARSTFVKEATRSLRDAANSLERGDFDVAAHKAECAAYSVAALIKGLKGDKKILPRGKW